MLDVVALSWSQMFNMDHSLKIKEVTFQEIGFPHFLVTLGETSIRY